MPRTPCFASDFVLCFGVVLCFDDVVLCFARRRTSCFEDAICFSLAIWVALRDAVLCSVTHAAPVSQFPCFLSVFAFAPSPSLSLGGGPCLSLPFAFSCSFLAGRSQKAAGRTGTPTACIRCAFFYLLLVTLQAQQPKNFARFAPLCAPRAINSTPSGWGTPFVLTSARSKVRKGPSHAV